MQSSSSHRVWEDAPSSSRGIQIAGWAIETRKKAILNAQEIETASEKLSIPLPEITFGNNLVVLRKTSSSSKKGKERANDVEDDNISNISFNTLDALALVDTTGADNLKVAHADKWAKSRGNIDSNGNGDTEFEIETVKNFDWTYSSCYPGTTEGDAMSFKPAPNSHPGIPLAKLARQDEPILFYDDVMLFEDELHDNGVANLSVKLRVMPSCFFLLARFFLRVDHVLFRIFDVRLYHDFSTDEVIRETKGKEAPYDDVKKRLPREKLDDLTPLTDSNWIANILGMLENDRPTGSPSTTSSTPRPSSASTAAPWADQTRRQVAPGVSLPVRSPLPPAANVSPPTPAKNSNGAKQEEGRKVWKGIGTSLEVARL